MANLKVQALEARAKKDGYSHWYKDVRFAHKFMLLKGWNCVKQDDMIEAVKIGSRMQKSDNFDISMFGYLLQEEAYRFIAMDVVYKKTKRFF